MKQKYMFFWNFLAFPMTQKVFAICSLLLSIALPPAHSGPDAEGFVLFLGPTDAPRASSHSRTFAPACCLSAYEALLSDLLKALT